MAIFNSNLHPPTCCEVNAVPSTFLSAETVVLDNSLTLTTGFSGLSSTSTSSIVQNFSILGIDESNKSSFDAANKKEKEMKTENYGAAQKSRKGREWQYEDVPLQIPSTFWNKYLTREMKLKKGWTDEINRHFQNKYFCVIEFEYYKCRKDLACKYFFHAIAHCDHSTCTSYKFSYEGHLDTHKPFDLRIFRDKEVNNLSGEYHKRFISGEERQKIAEELRSQSASKMKYKLLSMANEEKLASGNLNDIIDIDILHKIAAEDRAKTDLDRDCTDFMRKLYNFHESQWQGKVFNNFIQEYADVPLKAILFTEELISEVLDIPKGKVFCCVDATGSIISKPNEKTKAIYYYTILLPGTTIDNEKLGPFPVAEMISKNHSVPYFLEFFSKVSNKALLLSKRKPFIDKIEMDFSLALLQAASLSLNSISLIYYINVVFRQSKRLQKLTIIHICSSHMIKTAIHQMRKKRLSHKQSCIAKKIVSIMIHCSSLKSICQIFLVFWKIFVLSTDVEECEELVKKLDDLQSTLLTDNMDLCTVENNSKDDQERNILHEEADNLDQESDDVDEESDNFHEGRDILDEETDIVDEGDDIFADSADRKSSLYYKEITKEIRKLPKNEEQSESNHTNDTDYPYLHAKFAEYLLNVYIAVSKKGKGKGKGKSENSEEKEEETRGKGKKRKLDDRDKTITIKQRVFPNESFMRSVPDGTDIVSKVQQVQREKKKNIQPYIIIQSGQAGDKMFIQGDGWLIGMHSASAPITSFDLLYKMYYVLNLEYPEDLKNFYNFIDVFIFKVPGVEPKSMVASLHINILNMKVSSDVNEQNSDSPDSDS